MPLLGPLQALQALQVGTLPVAAASGVVAGADGIWIVADNHRALLRCARDGTLIERLALLRDDGGAIRKRDKPDLEALMRLPDGTLLALGSGSRPQRDRGWRVDPRTRRIQPVDLAPLYGALRHEIPELNIEGAAIQGAELVLAQRGNGAQRRNALLRLDLGIALSQLGEGHLADTGLRAIHDVALPDLDGALLSFTDFATDGRGALWFCAAAEATKDPFEDAPVSGSAIGRLGTADAVEWIARIEPRCKLEGLHLLASPPRATRWLLVADADDEAVPAPLFELTLADDA